MSEAQYPAKPPAVSVDTAHSPFALLRPVAIDAVTLTDSFWQPRREINRTVTLPSQFRHLEETDRLNNFRRAAGDDLDFVGIFFNDSDVYKWLEGAASAWTGGKDDADAALSAMMDTAIEVIAAAQQPDGYLNTYFTYDKAGERWGNLRDMHELYCAGHLFQAAVAHYRATGSDKLLAVARRFADYIDSVFGPDEGKRAGACGHPEIEMALVELYRATGEHRYLELSRFMVDVRGRRPSAIGGRNDAYCQDHVPFREMNEVTGHAVRMVYLAAGAADIYAETGETALKTALDRLWGNMTGKKTYVTGGVGSRWEGEAFGPNYELPAWAYAETCAAIGSLMWSWRMLAVSAASQFADAIELALYNGVLSGVSLDQQHYFYQNPLADSGGHRRQAWFGCACCPPNVARLLAQLPGYFYSTTDDSIYVHLYAAGKATIALPNGGTIALTQTTDYPWDAKITITVDAAPETPLSLRLRVPSWAEGATISINGDMPIESEPGLYLGLRRNWQSGDTITLKLPMPVRKIAAHPAVETLQGRIALQRGPLVYCVEQEDNPDFDIRTLRITKNSQWISLFPQALLNGAVPLRGQGVAISEDEWEGGLYQLSDDVESPRHVVITAIPYHVWANRSAGAMRVWLPTA